MMVESKNSLFSALLKHWRKHRGLSQMELALAADVSARHLSFLETGRAKPSRDMALCLGLTLQLSLRDQNNLLEAAGFDCEYELSGFDSILEGPVGQALEYMMTSHDPYPMVAMDWQYDLVMANQSASKVLQTFVAKPEKMSATPNLLEMIFHPDLCRPYIVDWEKTAHQMLARLHREALENNKDERLTALLNRLLSFDDIPAAWRYPDLEQPSHPTLSLSLKKGVWRFDFMMTMTGFSAPQNITIEELRIESYFPLNDETKMACIALQDSSDLF